MEQIKPMEWRSRPMKSRSFMKPALCVLLILALILGAVPAACAAGIRAVVVSNSMRVYALASPHKYLGSLGKGTVVTVEACSGQAALISLNGRRGIARVSDMEPVTEKAAASEPAQETKPAQAASPAGKPVVTKCATRIYERASTSSRYMTVKAGTPMTLIAVKGSCARVQRGSVTGFAYAPHLAAPGTAAPQTAEAAAPAPVEEPVVEYDRLPVITTASAGIYKAPTGDGDCVTVEKDTRMVLLAVRGSIAKVELNGTVGYALKAHLTVDTATQAAQAAEKAYNAKLSAMRSVQVDFGKGTNDQIIFHFLVRECGYNLAAAAGVVANIKHESNYRPGGTGDSGTSYGIVQWHAGRKDRLISWCGSNGYDYTTLKGQLYYLKYDLQHNYSSVDKRLKAVSNTPDGAYEAGYCFCYYFEAPSNKASKSVTRGNYARDTIFPKFAS